MTAILGLLAGFWVLGWVFDVAPWKRLIPMGLVWFGSGAVLVAAPGSDLALRLGGWRSWAALSVLGALVLAYRAGLRRLRARARASGRVPADWLGSAEPRPPATAKGDESGAPQPAKPGAFSPSELSRYARHILLREIGGPGQRALKEARVLVVGAGGLGSPALMYLAASGVGTIGVIDADVVDDSNLQRQIIHRTATVGQPKVASAAAAMTALNPHIRVIPHDMRLDETSAHLIADYDLILDGCDNFDTRYLVNRLCHAAKKPLISAAITQWEGQISLFHTALGTPCYQCCFPERPAPGMVPTCAEAGVAAPLPGILGAMMAMEALKHLTEAGETLKNRLYLYDALYTEARSFEITRRPDCPICGQG
ncbi:HesA/MoeB/ThiF family protein [Stagnihabitans tardus]|uniref:Molybdopterin-synthase adenylyltransferase n=1 Tax=Stagnihabitans tardus TaxID=2699202 RepID=A0AAE5BW86_9RHOB|nr:molybdopterin-synthase adenylyltransferase MoeB [Stagnihabitans tardus]NBZ88534.1 molybdopterin-synthase adenylyltransferase MoeB [Stagnihabitans tardus]